jgi:hypothetical protein
MENGADRDSMNRPRTRARDFGPGRRSGYLLVVAPYVVPAVLIVLIVLLALAR